MTCAGEKKARANIREACLQLVDLTYTGKCHIKARVRAADGREMNYIFSNSSCSRRGELNAIAALKRFARGQDLSNQRERQAA